jgi:apolipoprotein N-acyltransferase
MIFRKVERLSWLWLAVGAILLFLSSLQPSLPVAAWLAPLFLLRFTRTQRPWIGLPALALVSCIVMYSKWTIGFAPATMLGVSGAIAALVTVAGYAVDRQLTPRLSGLVATLVFPLATTSLDWLGSVLAAPLSSYTLPSLFSVSGTWNSPAYSQAGNLALMQIVALTGLWGLTFLISWFGSIVNALWEQKRPGQAYEGRPVRTSLIGFTAVMLAVITFGSARLAFFSPTQQSVRVAGIVPRDELFATIMQMNPQELMPGTAAQRDAARARLTPIVDDLFARSQQEANNGAKIVVWGETAAPVLEEDTIAVIEQASTLARRAQIYLQIAIVVFNNTDHYPFLQNRAIMLDPAGTVVWDYHKAYPTPGENTMVAAGAAVVPFIDTPYGRLATVICFDADFPGLVRQAGQAGVDILLLPYKDWASVSNQHAQMATFRAIENGVSLVRPVLSGLSTAIDPQGRTLAQVDAFTTGSPTLVTMVAMQGRATLYARIGDTFAYLCIAGLLCLIALGILRREMVQPSLMIEEPLAA